MQPKIETIVKKKLTCPKCNYTWVPRFDMPKLCPRCKYYFKEESKAQANQEEVN